jgi:hypothetical protein
MTSKRKPPKAPPEEWRTDPVWLAAYTEATRAHTVLLEQIRSDNKGVLDALQSFRESVERRFNGVERRLGGLEVEVAAARQDMSGFAKASELRALERRVSTLEQSRG